MDPVAQNNEQENNSNPVNDQPRDDISPAGAPVVPSGDFTPEDKKPEVTPFTPPQAQPDPTPQEVVAPAPPVESPVETRDTDASPAASQQAVAPLLPAHAKSGRPIGVIVAAIVIALLLAGLTIMVYLKTKNSIKPISNNSGQNSEQVATPADVDDATEALNQTLDSVKDDQDFNENDLSDTNLGL